MSFQSLEYYGTNPSGSHFQTCKGQENSRQKAGWVCPEQIVSYQPDCLMWWAQPQCIKGEQWIQLFTAVAPSTQSHTIFSQADWWDRNSISMNLYSELPYSWILISGYLQCVQYYLTTLLAIWMRDSALSQYVCQKRQVGVSRQCMGGQSCSSEGSWHSGEMGR